MTKTIVLVTSKHALNTVMEFVLELWAFLKQRKKYWLWPLFIVLLTLGTLVVFAEGSALAPFIYSLF